MSTVVAMPPASTVAGFGFSFSFSFGPDRAFNRGVYMHSMLLCVIGVWLCAALPDAAAQAIAPANVNPSDATAATAAIDTGSRDPVQRPAPRRPARQRIGDATTALLDMQVAGTAAAPALPMLGAAANLSWRRYLDSFTQPIPESFNHAVRKNDGGK